MNAKEREDSEKMPETQTNSGSAPYWRRLIRPLAIFSIALFLLSLVLCFVRWGQYRDLKRQAAELQAQVDDCRNRMDEMEDLLNGQMSRKNIERLAHEKLHLYYPDEVIFYSDING